MDKFGFLISLQILWDFTKPKWVKSKVTETHEHHTHPPKFSSNMIYGFKDKYQTLDPLFLPRGGAIKVGWARLAGHPVGRHGDPGRAGGSIGEWQRGGEFRLGRR